MATALLIALGCGILLLGGVGLAIRATRTHLRECPQDFETPTPILCVRVARRIARRARSRFYRPRPQIVPAQESQTPAEPPRPSLEEQLRALGFSGIVAHAPSLPDRRCATSTISTPIQFESVTRLHELIDVHDALAKQLIIEKGDFRTAQEVMDRRSQFQEEYARRLGLDPARVLLLNQEWAGVIGHMAILDTLAKMAQLGWASWERLVILRSPCRTVNPTYATYWKKYFTLLPDAAWDTALAPFERALGLPICGQITLPDRHMFAVHACGIIQEQWHREGRPPLLQLTAEDHSRGRELLRQLGIPDGSWFVCVHARSEGYRKYPGDTQVHRNASIQSYVLAVEAITARGGYVVRVGDAGQEPLPAHPRVVEYASGPHKSDWMDVFLLAACRFYLGGTCGLSHVPGTFGVPCALVNWASPTLPFFGPQDLFIPKWMHSERDRRPLTFAEYFHPSTRAASVAGTILDQQGLTVLNNTPEQIRDLVCEMLEQLDGPVSRSAHEEQLQIAFRDLAHGHGLAGFPRIGSRFLREYAHLGLQADDRVRRAS